MRDALQPFLTLHFKHQTKKCAMGFMTHFFVL